MSSRREKIRPSLWFFALLVTGILGGFVVFLQQANPGRPAALDDAQTRRNGSDRSGLSPGSDRQPRSSGSAFTGPPSPAFEGPSTLPNVMEEDPQVLAMRRSLNSGRGDASVPLQFTPSYYYGELASIEGNVGVNAGDTCEVRVLPVRTRAFNCLVRVKCGDVVLYPDSALEAGYVPCDVENGAVSRAVDDGVTQADGDPTVTVDINERAVEVTDAAPGGSNFSAHVLLQS